MFTRKPSELVALAPRLMLLVLGLVLFGCDGHQDREVVPESEAQRAARESKSRTKALPVSTKATTIRFEDMATKAGVMHINRDGHEAGLWSILEVMGGGIGITDYDRDDRPDCIVLGGGRFDVEGKRAVGLPIELYRNQGDWQFKAVAAQADVVAPGNYQQGVLVSDWNEDGWEDLLLTCFGDITLATNQGDGSYKAGSLFQGLPLGDDELWYFTGAAALDYDRDGLNDLFLANYCDWTFDHQPYCAGQLADQPRDVCSPNYFKGLKSLALHHDASGTWARADSAAGIQHEARSLGVHAGDLDGKGMPDVFIANDLDPNGFLVGQAASKYVDRALLCGVAMSSGASPDGSMGIAQGDFDRDGLADLVVTNFRRNVVAMHRQRTSGMYQFHSRTAKVLEVGETTVAWGVALVDLDLDGWVDMPIVNGDVFHRPAPSGDPRQRGLLFRNVGQGIFEDITATCEYLNQLHNSRGLAVADFDRDSLPDILVGNLNEPSGLLANRSTKQGHSLWIELVGTKSPRDPVGATVKLYCGKNVFAGYWTSGGSYLSSHERRLFFGLGPNTKIDVIEVTWPSGLRERFADQAVDGGFVIVEEQGIVFPAQGAGVQ